MLGFEQKIIWNEGLDHSKSQQILKIIVSQSYSPYFQLITYFYHPFLLPKYSKYIMIMPNIINSDCELIPLSSSKQIILM